MAGVTTNFTLIRMKVRHDGVLENKLMRPEGFQHRAVGWCINACLQLLFTQNAVWLRGVFSEGLLSLMPTLCCTMLGTE